MGGLKDHELAESVQVEYLDGVADTLQEARKRVAELDRPWIADEGPLAATFRRQTGDEPRPLEPRGLAFDRETTVQWDEDAVLVIRASEPEPGVLARSFPVLVRDRFREVATEVRRVDYLRRGVLIASRYLPAKEGGRDA